MKTGEIVLIPFPFAELNNRKVRPAIIICTTKDQYKDLVVCAISSVLPQKLSTNEFYLMPDSFNNLRVKSVAKIDRIATTKREDVIATLGKLSPTDLQKFKDIFKKLID